MMKSITKYGAFLITFLLSVGLVGLPVSHQRNISSLLRQDVSNGFEMRVDVYGLNREELSPASIYSSREYGEIVSDYSYKMTTIDESDLPADFLEAWQEHKAAWQEHSAFLNENRTRCKMRKLSGDDFKHKFARQDAEISATWFRVLSIAQKYDVKIPSYYY